jgi:hypothetical protein
MSVRATVLIVILLGAILPAPGPSVAGLPFPPFCSCTVSIVQNPARSQCINNFAPAVIRLCPSLNSPVFDTMTFNLVILDALGAPVTGASVRAYERSGTVNIADGGSTTALTDAQGRASIAVTRGSGCGRIGACVEGILICDVAVRSVDVAWGPTPATCALPTTGTSAVNASDVTNPSCGFFNHFGAVTVGVNDCWDCDCSNIVNASDVQGTIGKGCWLQHGLHAGVLGGKSTCP